MKKRRVKKDVKKHFKIWVLVIFVGLIVTGVSAYFIFKDDSSGVDKTAVKYESSSKRPSSWGSNQIAVPGYTGLEMKANTNIINVALFNPKGNPCYFKYSIKERKSKEVLFQSDLVPPGSAIVNPEISKKFSKGSYKLTIVIDTYSLQDGTTPKNGSEVLVTLVAK